MTLLTTAPIRRLSRADLPRCLDLCTDRGWSREDRKWRLLLTAGIGYGIDDPEGDGLIGCCVLTHYGPGLACVSMALVAERHARRGLGRKLMTHVLEEADGTPVFLYATDMGRPLYEQLGFTPVTHSATHVGRLAPEPEREAGPLTRPATASDLPALLALDAEVFGADRMPMLTRLPAFAEHVRVAECPEGLTGFAAAWSNVDNTVIGPVVADSTATARHLISDLAVHTESEIRLDVDVRHPELGHWLDTHGVTPSTANTLMIHGAPDLPGDYRRRFAPLMVALG
ncbi:GNAT family N-acetyltransferase [Streptomyces pathocidini]|uniref:GNAT family N-acetyltransferase n=1 Tax=Streptomyces pathocidini TaxID=1650571 RepID=UPI0033C7A8F3